MAFKVPTSPFRNAIQRNDTTELGTIQAAITMISTVLRTLLLKPKRIQAKKNPSTAWPSIAEPIVKIKVTFSELKNAGSLKARLKFSKPIISGSTAEKPVRR